MYSEAVFTSFLHEVIIIKGLKNSEFISSGSVKFF